MRVATDVGGTFTDLVYYDVDVETGSPSAIQVVKTDTTPPDFEEGVMQCLERSGLDPSRMTFFAHGTTVVINALLSRTGAKTGLITTRGFRDVLEIARGNRPDLFNFYFRKPTPFVPRYLRQEVTERASYKGEILTEVALEEIEPVLDLFRREGIKAIAVSFLHAYANPTNEIKVVNEIKRQWPEVSVVASHRITREWREYERTSTAVLAAYVHPIVSKYLSSLDRRLREVKCQTRPFIMQSNGGIGTIKGATANPIAMVESGPSSGVLGAIELGRIIGEPNIVTLDIGGTTAKCALIEHSQARVTTDYKIEWTRTNPGYPIKTPVIEMVEIGSGGGSIAWLDAGGKLHVGPQSAGAVPGPAAYGRGGTAPTTTDAQLVTGRINPDCFLGGDIKPDMDAVRKAFKVLMEKLSVTVEEAARGVIRIANANMVNALKLVSVNKGYDPRDFCLAAFGGGGAMHAISLAEELGFPRVIVPTNSAVFSAWSMLLTDLRRDYVRTHLVEFTDETGLIVGETFDEMSAEAIAEFSSDGISEDRLTFQRYADMRYLGQEHSVKVEFPDGMVGPVEVVEVGSLFHEAHERLYTFRLDRPVELVNHHLVVIAEVPRPEIPKVTVTGATVDEALRGSRRVDFDESGIHEALIYERAVLEPGHEILGPAIVEEPAATLLLPPRRRLSVDSFGNLCVELDS